MANRSTTYIALAGSAGLIALIAAAHSAYSRYHCSRRVMTPTQRRLLRQQLPKDLMSWRIPGDSEGENRIWFDLESFLLQEGIELWPLGCSNITLSPRGTYPVCNGFASSLQSRGIDKAPGSAFLFTRFIFVNSLCRAVRTREGHDLIARVIVIGAEGKEHLDIVRKLGTAPISYFSENHCLPLLREIELEGIVFGLFPRAGISCEEMYGYWAKNSVGDILEIILQSLEALRFIHGLKIAHRDAFKDNFLVQWYPESMLAMKVSPSRPRVYFIDFEFAAHFSPDSTATECMTAGPPISHFSVTPEKYARPCPLIMLSEKPYCPFKLDVWQLGISYCDFKSTIPAIDEILLEMCTRDPDQWMDADTVLRRLSDVVHGMKPAALLMLPEMVERLY